MDGMHPVLAELKERLDALSVEQDIHLEHLEKLAANLDFLRKEALIVKLSEFKTIFFNHTTTNLQLRLIEKDLSQVQSECAKHLKIAEKIIAGIKEIDEALNHECEIIPLYDK